VKTPERVSRICGGDSPDTKKITNFTGSRHEIGNRSIRYKAGKIWILEHIPDSLKLKVKLHQKDSRINEKFTHSAFQLVMLGLFKILKLYTLCTMLQITYYYLSMSASVSFLLPFLSVLLEFVSVSDLSCHV